MCPAGRRPGACPCLSGFHTPGHHTPLGLGVSLSIRTQMTVSTPRPLSILCCSSDTDTWRLLDFASDPLQASVCPVRVTHADRPESFSLTSCGSVWLLVATSGLPAPTGAHVLHPRGGGEQRANRDGQVGPHEDSWWPELPAGDKTSVDKAWLLRPEDTRPRLSWPETQRRGHSLEVASLPAGLRSLCGLWEPSPGPSNARRSPDPPGGCQTAAEALDTGWPGSAKAAG